MVQEVQAFQSSDGKVHLERIDALRQDAYLSLERLSIFQHATINALLEHVTEVAPVLEAYAKEIRKASADTKPA